MAGTLDDDAGTPLALHVLVEHRAPWFEITDSLPQLTAPSWVYLMAVAAENAGHDPTSAYESFLAQFPESEHAPQARRRLAELGTAASPGSARGSS